LRTWCDRKRFIEAALFPSYVFIYAKSVQEFLMGADAAGALHYVRFGKEVVRVSDAVISNIKLVVDESKDMEVSYDYFQPGQQFYIQRGPFTGLTCEIVRVNGNHKILIRVNLLQRSLLATLPSEDLMAISA
ncbi:MAG: antitermination protein NusG, partial [Chitinophagaceae bacterium]